MTTPVKKKRGRPRKSAAKKKTAEPELTPLQREQKNLKELRAKLQSEAWRMTNLYMIEDKWGNLVHFKPNKAQIQLFKDRHNGGNMILKARQLGISTAIALWLLDKLWTNQRHTAGIIDKTLTDAEAKLRKIKIAYENMDNKKVPGWRIGSYIKSQVKITSASSGRIEFSNGSSIVAGKSLRGGTVQYLHISELGKIAQEEPKKAEEIVSGSLNTIAPGNVVFAESTHEGGRIGLHYKLLKASMENDPENLSPVDMKFFFFPWFWDKSYKLDPTHVKLRPEMVEYFGKLEREHNIVLTDEQKAWYDRKQFQQTDSMLKEFPTTPDEAFESSTRDAIYARHIAQARAEGRILDFEYESGLPVITSWDLGVSDYTSIWAVQFVGREIHWLDWYEAAGESVSHFAAVMREWDRKYGNIAMHYLPHDAGYRDKNATTYLQHLAEAGITNVTVVPRTPDIWLGINKLRDMLKRSLFHKTNCGTPRVDVLGDEHLSGIDCLEAYRTKGEQPVHDETSHSCDAARTIAEAYSRGMVGRDGSVPALRGKQFRPRVITGTGNQTRHENQLRAIR